MATWLVLPFYQQYSEAGDFTVKARCRPDLGPARGWHHGGGRVLSRQGSRAEKEGGTQ